MEEKHVLDEDQAVHLRNSREEAVQNPRGLEGLEVRRAGAPSSCSERDNQEVKHHGQTAEISAECHDW